MTLHPQSLAAIELWSQQPGPGEPGFDIARQRAAARAAAAAEPREEVAESRDVDADGVTCRLFRPARTGDGGLIVFLHGGGFVFGDLDTHDAQSRRLANRTGLPVLAVDYRRPPEHRFPAAPDDVDTVLRWLRRAGAGLGVDTDRPVVVGDSAGGNLALVAALRNPGLFTACVLVYPFLDPRGRYASPAGENGGLTSAEGRWYWDQYAADPADLQHPDLAPLGSDRLGTVPPTLIVAAEHDLLRGEDVELARRIEDAGGSVELSTYPGMIHGFWRHPALFDAAEESLAEIAGFLRRRTSIRLR